MSKKDTDCMDQHIQNVHIEMDLGQKQPVTSLPKNSIFGIRAFSLPLLSTYPVSLAMAARGLFVANWFVVQAVNMRKVNKNCGK